MRRSASILVPLTAVLLLLPDGARSSTVTIFGNINWTDSAGGTHPIRFADVNLFDVDGGGDQLLLLSSSDGSGGYSLTVPNLEEDLTGQDPFVEIRAVNPAGMVSTDSTIANIHEFESALIAADIPDGAHQADYIVPNTTTAGHAFSVSEAIYTGYRYAEIVRGVAPTGVSVRFTAGGSFYCASGNETGCNGVAQELNLVAGDRWDWDVILHEYGHHLSAQDGLDDSPGGSHAFGTSNIPSKGKDAGTRLAWGEGLANYISLAAQAVTAASGDLPAVPNTGGTVYQDTIDQTLSVNIETHAGSGNDGEGDETSVMRILWDIADPANEAHDLLAIGHGPLLRQSGRPRAGRRHRGRRGARDPRRDLRGVRRVAGPDRRRGRRVQRGRRSAHFYLVARERRRQ